MEDGGERMELLENSRGKEKKFHWREKNKANWLLGYRKQNDREKIKEKLAY